MNLWKTLQSPFALALQGFVAGGILFFALQPIEGDRATDGTAGRGSVIETLQV